MKKSTAALAAVHSKEVVMLLSIRCLLLLSLFVGICFVMQYFVSFLFLKSCLAEAERASFFTSIVFLVTCGCYCSVALPRGA